MLQSWMDTISFSQILDCRECTRQGHSQGVGTLFQRKLANLKLRMKNSQRGPILHIIFEDGLWTPWMDQYMPVELVQPQMGYNILLHRMLLLHHAIPFMKRIAKIVSYRYRMRSVLFCYRIILENVISRPWREIDAAVISQNSCAPYYTYTCNLIYFQQKTEVLFWDMIHLFWELGHHIQQRRKCIISYPSQPKLPFSQLKSSSASSPTNLVDWLMRLV